MIYGENRVGKSQLASTVCVSCFQPEQVGGAEGKALFIDTEGTFRPDRIESIAQRFHLEAEFVLNRAPIAAAARLRASPTAHLSRSGRSIS